MMAFDLVVIKLHTIYYRSIVGNSMDRTVGGIPWLCRCLRHDQAQDPRSNLGALHSQILGSLRLRLTRSSGEAGQVQVTIRRVEVAEEAVATTVIWQG